MKHYHEHYKSVIKEPTTKTPTAHNTKGSNRKSLSSLLRRFPVAFPFAIWFLIFYFSIFHFQPKLIHHSDERKFRQENFVVEQQLISESTVNNAQLTDDKIINQEGKEDTTKHNEISELTRRLIHRYPFNILANVETPISPTDTAIFWQIPRTGGTTLKHILGSCLNKVQASRTSKDYCDIESSELHICYTKIGPFVNADTSDNHGIQRAAKLNLIRSGLSDVIVSSRFIHTTSLFETEHQGRAFTVIRDPIERMVSTFYYLREARWERNYRDDFKNMTLIEYVNLDETTSDWMTRWLTGQQSASVVTQEHLDLAKEILRRKFLILLTDEMKSSVERLLTYMHWKPKNTEEAKCILDNVTKMSKHNKSFHPNIMALSDEELSAVKAKNKLDLELYDFALEIYSEQWRLTYSINTNI